MPTNEEKANQIKKDANTEYERKHYETAIKLYSDALLLTDLSDELSGALFSNRAMAYLKLHMNSSNKMDQRHLARSLNDAKMAKSLCPRWFKAHYTLGLVHQEMNDLESAVASVRTSLLLKPGDEELKNALAGLNHALFEQARSAHLDETTAAASTEERHCRFTSRKLDQIFGKNNGSPNFDYGGSLAKSIVEMCVKEDPVLADVWLAHEYRDGCVTRVQDFQLAAEYYAKAAKAGNAEALYSLGLFYEKG